MQRVINKQSVMVVLAALMLSVGVGAQAHRSGHGAASVQPEHFQSRYNEVDRVSAFRVHRWAPVDRSHVIIWTSPKRAYLVTLRRPVHGLRFAQHIGVTRTVAAIHKNFDHVIVDGVRHPIAALHALDHRDAQLLARR